MFKSVSLHNQSVLKLGTESMAMITETRPWQPRRRRNHQRWNQRKLRLWLFELKSYKHRVTLWLQFVALYTAAFYSTTLGLWLRKVWLLCAGLIALCIIRSCSAGSSSWLIVTCGFSVLQWVPVPSTELGVHYLYRIQGPCTGRGIASQLEADTRTFCSFKSFSFKTQEPNDLLIQCCEPDVRRCRYKLSRKKIQK